MAPTTMIPDSLEKPAAEEFGAGPRLSAKGLYRAKIDLPKPLVTGAMQRLTLNVTDSDGHELDSIAIAVGGGMPDHGHGLPTTPKATRQTARGAYQIDGVRFNMGGWWVLAFALDGPAGADTVTFNFDL
ncbi:MAG: FixH family protein [bacterium]|nr:FixH family protein [Candidatus Kapabacteria bacterium]